MRIAAEGGSVPPAVPDAVARVLEFTQVARAGDLSLVLGALSAAELTAGIARLVPRLPELVIEHEIAHGPPAARNTPAWQLTDELCAPHPDDPASWPLENAVRQHLDNSPDRWRIMVRRLMEAGPLEYAQPVDLVQAVGGGAGEAAEGEP